MASEWISEAKVLMVVKAYPTPSRTYDELVCCAGLLDGREWIRIYPVPFRFLSDKSQFPKFSWIQVDLERNPKDFRPESYRPRLNDPDAITVVDYIPASKEGWESRRQFVFNHVETNMSSVIEQSTSPTYRSIAVVRPKRIKRCYPQPEPEGKYHADDQMLLELFPQRKNQRPVSPLPYRFKCVFLTDDGKERDMMIEDWELGALFRNCLSNGDSPEVAANKVCEKVMTLNRTRDLHLIVGTTFQWHKKRAPNPFVIIGLFYPPDRDQAWLFPLAE